VSFAQVPQGISHRGTAYNSSGVILQSTNVSIKVRILNGNGGVEVFSEIHNLMTNNNGQYSLNIGEVQPVQFSAIDWSEGNKWLEIGIALQNTTNYVVGSSQLMSVPYALYAQKIDKLDNNSPIITVNTINELRNSDFHNEDLKVIYVKCHSLLQDGGGGFFYWIDNVPNDSTYDDNDGTIIKPINHNSVGRWLRKLEGFIDVRYFGCLGHSQIDDGVKIQKAIDFASNNYQNNFFTKGNVVFLRNGSYHCNKLTLKSGVSLIGESKENTIIASIKDTNPYLLEIDEGVVNNIAIENITFSSIESDPNSIKGCLNFKAKPNLLINNVGGLWNSRFKNLRILRFTGTSINFEGGGANSEYNLPNQFNTLENVEAEGVGSIPARQSGGNSFLYPPVLKIAGQNAQYSFINCRFDGGSYLFSNNTPLYKINGINVYIGSITGDLDNVDDRVFYPTDITFNTCTFQSGELGFFIQSGETINIQNSWFENFERAIFIKGNDCLGAIFPEGCAKSKNINIQNNKFLYSAGRFGFLPPDSGRVILVNNAQVNIQNNYVIDPSQTEDTYFVSSDGQNTLGVNLENNYFDPPKLGKTYGIVQKRNITSINGNGYSVTGLVSDSNKLVFVENATSSSSSNVYRIESSINTGETIFVRAEKGGLIFYPFNASTGTLGRNIYLNGRTSLTLIQGQAATFIKLDNIVGAEFETYQLLCISN